jgi:uncharacterized protein YjbI with pentapeptide repeats
MPSTRLTASAGFAIAFGALAATGAPAADGVRMTAREVTETLFKADAGTHPDFGSADLNGLDLAELDFKGARLPGANLYGADLSHANLTGTDLKGAHLDRATITSANFSGADLTDARILRPTIFTTLEVVSSEAPKFTGAKLVRIRSDGWLDRADFSGADLTSAVFGGGATREESLFSPASLVSTNFTRAILKEAKFPGAKLKYARFIDADLRGANLRGTDLTQADFTGADLTDADVTGANLDEADLRSARGLDSVIGLATASNIDKALRASTP